MKRFVYLASGLALFATLFIAGCTSSDGKAGDGVANAAPVGANATDGSVAQTGIYVSGTGSVKIKPDVAQVQLGVQVIADSAQQAQSQAATLMDKVIASLKANGITEENIKTVAYSVSPYQEYNKGQTANKGYQVTNLVALTVKDVTKLGTILDAAAAAGANQMNGVSFTTADPTAAQTQARELAMNNAKAKAQQLAKLAGVTLGKPVYVSESVSNPPPVPVARTMGAGADMQASTPVMTGEMEITVNVTVQYALQ